MDHSDKPKRQHRATGKKPPGGAREGAGRTLGGSNALEYGEGKALKAARLRVPEGTTEPIAHLADAALQTILDVMTGQVHFTEAGPRLKAATHVRSEVCGPVAQKLDVTGSVSIAVVDPYAKKPPGV